MNHGRKNMNLTKCTKALKNILLLICFYLFVMPMGYVLRVIGCKFTQEIDKKCSTYKIVSQKQTREQLKSTK